MDRTSLVKAPRASDGAQKRFGSCRGIEASSSSGGTGLPTEAGQGIKSTWSRHSSPLNQNAAYREMPLML